MDDDDDGELIPFEFVVLGQIKWLSDQVNKLNEYRKNEISHKPTLRDENKCLQLSALQSHTFQSLLQEYEDLPAIDRMWAWCKDHKRYDPEDLVTREMFLNRVTLAELHPMSLQFLNELQHEAMIEMRRKLENASTFNRSKDCEHAMLKDAYKNNKKEIKLLREKNMRLTTTMERARGQTQSFLEWKDTAWTTLGKRQRQISGLLECVDQYENDRVNMRPLLRNLNKIAKTEDESMILEDLRRFAMRRSIPAELNLDDVDVPEPPQVDKF